MMTMTLLLLSLISAGVDEDTIAVKDLPAVVSGAVKTKFPQGKLTEASKEVEDGKTSYEVKVTDGGETIEVSLSDAGKILEQERTIAVKDLPAAVTTAVAAKHPGSTIKKAEAITRYGDAREEKSFEVVVTLKGKDVELELSHEGKILEDESDDEDEKAPPGKGDKPKPTTGQPKG